MKTMNYDVDYFIKKFKAIPEDKWWTGTYGNRMGDEKCALGHCGMSYALALYNNESSALHSLMGNSVIKINDGENVFYQQPTPKQRILAALYDIKKIIHPEPPKEKTIIKYVSVPQSIKQQTEELVLS